MESGKRLTLEALIAKKEQREKEKFEVHKVDVPSLDGYLQLEKIPLTRMVGLMDEANGASVSGNLAFYVDLIYACCPMLRNKELQAAYGVTEPTDIVCAVLEDNMGEISRIASVILAMYGMSDGDDLKEVVKN